MRSVLRPALPLIAGRCVAFAATFLIPILVVRMFDQASVGTYKQVFLIYSTLFAIAQFGLAESLYYFLPTHPGSAGRLTLNAMTVLAAIGVTGALVLGWNAGSVARWLGNPDLAPLLPYVAAYLALTLTAAGLEIVMIARNRFRMAALSMALSEIVRAAMFLIPALLTGELRWLLAGGVAFGLFRLIAGGAYLKREFRGDFRLDRGLLRKQLAYAIPFQMAILVETLQVNLHQYAVSYSFDAATFAIYAVGCLQIPTSEFVAAPLSNVMMVRMAEQLKEGDVSGAQAIWDNTTRKLMFIMLPLTGLFVVVAHDLITLLFTSAYAASAPIFTVWALAIALQALPTDSVLRVFADTRAILALNLLRLIFIVSLIGIAMSRFGLLGPVLVTVVSAFLARGLALVRISRLLSSGMRHVLPWRAAAISAGAVVFSGLAAAMVRNRLDLEGALALGVSASVYSACFAAMILGWWLLKTKVVKTCAELPESSV